eukprot:CAMPEP_0180699564 /NCGR_PEP_ID=MMETSP1038_2-20121128/4619_1 /TAXON_ID=632150 /ORGANISM="Azadinium spinosum, Strain 3D9" /LENGTH=40 /DNA_ID= /DNA_START= /DNA_END= /DNA_ORIENTATION=
MIGSSKPKSWTAMEQLLKPAEKRWLFINSLHDVSEKMKLD